MSSPFSLAVRLVIYYLCRNVFYLERWYPVEYSLRHCPPKPQASICGYFFSNESCVIAAITAIMTSRLYDSNKAIAPLRGSPYFVQPERLARPEARNLRSFRMLSGRVSYDYDVAQPVLGGREER